MPRHSSFKGFCQTRRWCSCSPSRPARQPPLLIRRPCALPQTFYRRLPNAPHPVRLMRWLVLLKLLVVLPQRISETSMVEPQRWLVLRIVLPQRENVCPAASRPKSCSTTACAGAARTPETSRSSPAPLRPRMLESKAAWFGNGRAVDPFAAWSYLVVSPACRHRRRFLEVLLLLLSL